jgi:ADP-ribose pyrophosphatase YjhB (NUDIX family)
MGKFDNWAQKGYFTNMYPENDEYDGPRGADVIVYCATTNSLLLLVRGKNPFKGFLVPPGGGVNENESFRQAAVRELQEETGIVVNETKLQIIRDYRYDDFDPRGKLWARRYLLTVDEEVTVVAADDAVDHRWIKVDEVPFWMLAIEHAVGLRDALLYAGVIPSEPQWDPVSPDS